MKLMHLSDLHLGKRLNEYSLLEDQKDILNKILDVARTEAPDAVLIAGDVYDRSVAPEEAVELFDGFLSSLAKMGKPVCIISGNHDSAERLAFGRELMEGAQVHISPAYKGEVGKVVLEDGYGPVNVYLLPFIKPAYVRRYCPEETIESWTDAVRAALAKAGVEAGARNVLVAHQFVTGAATCDSEETTVGGADNVDASVFDAFDYVALGHLHGPQNVGGDVRIRYCGTPLKYSFSEEKHTKSVTIAELGKKGELQVREVQIKPLRDLRTVRGTYSELMALSCYEAMGEGRYDYLRIVLTDEQDMPHAMGRLQGVYPNLMKLEYDNTRTRTVANIVGTDEVQKKDPLTLFEELYKMQNGAPMSAEQRKYINDLIAKLREEER